MLNEEERALLLSFDASSREAAMADIRGEPHGEVRIHRRLPYTPQQFARYTEIYRQPQQFVRIGRKIAAVPVEAKKQIGTYELFQLTNTEEAQRLRFISYDGIAESGGTVSRDNYASVYSGPLYQGKTLDDIYERFNLHHLSGFRGHSLSVSDVIVVNRDGQDQAWYVDYVGFEQVPEFLARNPLEKVEEQVEDDYDMVDGLINNGDRGKESEGKSPLSVRNFRRKAGQQRMRSLQRLKCRRIVGVTIWI